MAIIDAHYHLRPREQGAFAIAKAKGEVAEEAVELMDEKGVDMCVCMAVPSPKHTVEEVARRDNDFIATEINKFPKRFVGFCMSSPFGADGGAKEFERAVKQLGMKGIKLHPEQTSRNTLDLLSPIFEKARELNVPVSIHSSDANLSPDRIGFFARTFPDVTFIMAHMGGGGSFTTNWRFCVEQAKANENIILETSGFFYYPGAIKTAVKAIGAERVVWGTDGPFMPIDLPWWESMFQQAGLTQDQKKLILGGAIARLLRI